MTNLIQLSFGEYHRLKEIVQPLSLSCKKLCLINREKSVLAYHNIEDAR